MYSVLNKFSDYIYFYIPKNITSYIFVLVFKIVESLEGDIKEHNQKVCNKDIKIFCQGFYFGGSFLQNFSITSITEESTNVLLENSAKFTGNTCNGGLVLVRLLAAILLL